MQEAMRIEGEEVGMKKSNAKKGAILEKKDLE